MSSRSDSNGRGRHMYHMNTHRERERERRQTGDTDLAARECGQPGLLRRHVEGDTDICWASEARVCVCAGVGAKRNGPGSPSARDRLHVIGSLALRTRPCSSCRRSQVRANGCGAMRRVFSSRPHTRTRTHRLGRGHDGSLCPVLCPDMLRLWRAGAWLSKLIWPVKSKYARGSAARAKDG